MSNEFMKEIDQFQLPELPFELFTLFVDVYLEALIIDMRAKLFCNYQWETFPSGPSEN